jgi:hypothetical protein
MQEIIQGLIKSYACNNRIVIYAVSSLGITTLKSWSDAVIDDLDHLPDEYENYLVVYDLSGEGVALPFLTLTGYNIYKVGITTAGQKRAENVLQGRPDLKIRLAFVLAPSLSGDMAMRRGQQARTDYPQIDYKIFFDRSGAIDWLEHFVPT